MRENVDSFKTTFIVICTVPSLYAVDSATPTAYDPLTN